MTSRYASFKAASEMARELAKQGSAVSINRNDDGWFLTASGGSAENLAASPQETLRVFELESGAIIVLDPNVEVEGEEKRYGYSLTRNTMRQYEESLLNDAIPVTGPRRAEALSKYQLWKKDSYERFVVEERAYVYEKKWGGPIRKHREYLEKIGKPYSGVNVVTSKRHRTTHCYACAQPLTSDFHIECNACGWLICECGACGCSYVA